MDDLERYARWLGGEATPEEQQAVEERLADPESGLSRSLRRLPGLVPGAERAASVPVPSPAIDPPPAPQDSRDSALPPPALPVPLPWYRQPAFLRTVLAASVLLAALAVLWWEFTSPRPTARNPAVWGWMRGDFPTTGSPQDCFAQLADSLAEWNDLRPTTRSDMARRVAEVRLGCTRLQFAELRPLSDAARADLRKACRGWAQSFADDLTDLESETADAHAAYERADRRVQEMIGFLRDKARG